MSGSVVLAIVSTVVDAVLVVSTPPGPQASPTVMLKRAAILGTLGVSTIPALLDKMERPASRTPARAATSTP
ncbi:MAG: hypothetical protein H0T76_07335 [Nannocystis sp.]|nr:hypothetical protein [Nannocystis sp.]MBA3546276.1 hypothetical protein [Nannocystis sp.]